MGSLGGAAVAISVAALAVAAWAAFDLSRGAARGEARVWLIVGLALALSAAERTFAAIQYARAGHAALPGTVQVSLLLGAVTLAGMAAALRPIILRYRRAAEARRESDARFRRALSAASDPIGIIDGDGIYSYVNDAGCEFFKYPREQILGRHFRDFIADVDPSSKGTVDRAVGVGAAQVEREVRCGDGTVVPVYCDLIALGDDSVLLIGHDLSARRDAEASRARAERLEAVSTLAAGVAHDFNNLLSVIGVSLDMAMEDAGEPEHLGRAIRATTRAAGLSRELIEFARAAVDRAQRPASLTPDIRAVVSDAVDATKEGLDRRIRLQLDLPPAPLPVAAGSGDVHRICTNLLTNARDAVLESLIESADPGTARGHVDLSVRMVGAAVEHAAPGVEIVVRDTGTGMSPEIRDRVFEPFFTTKTATQGYGLGLVATRELVAELDGTITVDSRPGVGTTFTVWLPLATERASAPRRAGAVAETGRGQI